MSQERLIRKYANRRLYDTVGSRHVTLADLRQLVIAGERLKVVDDKSGEELTRSVLLQIIADQEQFGAPTLSTELLEMIIRFYASPVQSMLTAYLEQGFTALLRQQDAMRGEMDKVLGTSAMAPFVDLARSNMEAFARMQAKFFGIAPGAMRPQPQSPPPAGDAAAPRDAADGSESGADPSSPHQQGK
jgi:polyhydroxyalkanoate synthesis repressor PhaR